MTCRERELTFQLHTHKLICNTKKNRGLETTKEELLVVIGGILMSGYAKYPNKTMYWSKENDVPIILAEGIRCNRFEAILRNLHLNDNTPDDGSDKLFKLRPILRMLGVSFKKHGGLEENISIDESMIAYYGKHYAKQFIGGKPIRFGFKNWALCASNGYLVAFQPYTGKSEEQQRESGLIHAAGIPTQGGHKVFTSVGELGICATGTMQENRVEKCPLKSKAEMKKEKKRIL